jgi:hypothetical protein
MRSTGHKPVLILSILLAGCISREERTAQHVVESYLGDFSREKLSGPYGKKERGKLAALPQPYEERANELLETGAIFFVTFQPHDLAPGGNVAVAQGGMDSRVIFILDAKVVANYPARK